VREQLRAPDAILLGAWARGPADVWIVGLDKEGDSGLVRHWDGKTWNDRRVPGSASIWEIWGLGSHELWWVGTSSAQGGFVMRGQDTSFSPVEFKGKALRGVWGSAANDVWVLPYEAPPQHWDGSQWSAASAVSKQPLLSIWGSSRNDVWAVGLAGAIVRYDGVSWSRSTSGTTDDLWSVWGSGASDVWAVGANGTMLRFNGKVWRKLSTAAAH
jgi:hypothetical protein